MISDKSKIPIPHYLISYRKGNTMKIRFNQDVELQVIEGFDEEADAVTDACFERFGDGEVHDVDLLDFVEDGNGKVQTCTIQFGDGSCSYNVQRSWFDFVEK